MPLVRLQVRNEYGLGDPALYRVSPREDPKAILDGVAVAGLIGILRQLGDLAEFASDIFHELREQVMTTSSRGRKLLARVKQLEMELPNVESVVQGQRSYVHFSYEPGSDWHADLKIKKSHLLSSDLPQFMMDSYEECREPPRLYLLDKFDTAGTGACLKRYSDPAYFKREWDTLELKKAEKVQRQRKAQKIKRKGSQIKTGERISLSQRHSSTQFASPSTEELHNSTGSSPISDTEPKPKFASRSTYFGSRMRMDHVEKAPDTNSCALLDEPEHDGLSDSKLQIDQSGSFASDAHDKLNGDCTADGSPHGWLKVEISCRSPSVEWDEKTEILKSTSPRSCNNITLDGTEYLEPLQASSEQSNMELESSVLGTMDQGNSIFDTENVQTPLSNVNHFEEVNSETDNYMDAHNMLESETETDTECQTKREIKSMSNCNKPSMESGTSRPQEMTSTASDVSGIDTVSGPHGSSNENIFPLKLVPSRSVGPISNPGDYIDDQISELNAGDMSSICEGVQDSLPPELSISGSPAILGPRTTTSVSQSPDSPPVNFSNIPSPKFWTNGGLLGLEPSKPPVFSVSKVPAEDFVSDSGNVMYEHSNSLEGTTSHYNGLTTEQETMSTSNEITSRSYSFIKKADGLPKASLNGHQHFGRSDNVFPQLDPSQCSSTYLDNQLDSTPANQNSHRHLQACSSFEFQKVQGAHHSYISAENGCHNIVPKGDEFPSSHPVESKPNGSGQNTMDIKSSLSALAQRILANSLQRKPSIAQAHSENVNADSIKQQEISPLNNQKEGPTRVVAEACYPENTNNTESISSKTSNLSSPHLPGHFSPPLEHMKISFHPMTFMEASKLKLEYSSVDFDENIEDVTFPSFRLLPGPHVPVEYDCSETDDDTFCIKSCPCTSEDHLSPRSDSYSELWGQEDLSEGQSNEMYNGVHRVSLSSSSVSSIDRFGQMCQVEATENLEAENSILYFQNSNSVCLPGLDSVTHTHNGGVCDSFRTEALASQSQTGLPPPPPLPPILWTMKDASVHKAEKKDSSVAEIVERFNVMQAQRLTAHKQQELNVPSQPPFPEIMSCPIKKLDDEQNMIREEIKTNDKGEQKRRKDELLHQTWKKHDQQKLNAHKELEIPCANGQEVDEREELLHQIRNKSFNLRHTSSTKPSPVSQATTNTNVAAILEKANAIRQAFVGSDDGGDDDNWSDG
ncbi:uncharacterized protein A4U43_C01F13800 [Asparagus officinalis]|uniref:Protein SCAR n=1 Tax=Asparagus officinalis TaxID=4686 RepID=A0A5P1FTQ2_ASPOF|nr:SCAR-like protein 2 [Asparagus officinalis]ONK80091.1 uncharacterized protein A4U43_C01F13800 [Asparagus officinalis]